MKLEKRYKLSLKNVKHLSIGIYILSLTQVCFSIDGDNVSSLGMLMVGAIGFYSCAAGITWLANPLLYIAWRYSGRNAILAMITSILSTLTMLSFLLFKEIMHNEAGGYGIITGYKLGYWLWLSSSLTMSIFTVLSYFRKKKRGCIRVEFSPDTDIG